MKNCTIYEKLSHISKRIVYNAECDLCHYTSINTIKEIIKNNELWLSHYEYLNDPNEVLFGINVLQHLVHNENIFKKLNSVTIFKKVKNRIKSDSPIFILSLTTERDSLSQWFAYGDRGAGCSVYINIFILKRIMKNVNYRNYGFYPIIYYDDNRSVDISGEKPFLVNDTKNRQFEDNILESLACLNDELNSGMNEKKIEDLLVALLITNTALIKNSFYKDEKEYRLILVLNPNDINISTNINDKQMKVIYKLSIEQHIHKLITEIKIGPKFKRTEGIEYALSVLCNNYRLDSVNISYSDGNLR